MFTADIIHHHDVAFYRTLSPRTSEIDAASHVILLITFCPAAPCITTRNRWRLRSSSGKEMAFQTPQRPLPGAFFNTPAPSRYPPPRQPVFTAGGGQSRNPSSSQDGQQPLAPLRDSQSLQPIQRAARTINEVLQREASFPDLDSYVRRKWQQPRGWEILLMFSRGHFLRL